VSEVLRAGLFSEDFNDWIFVRLVLVGAVAGLVNERMRVGLGAALATLVVVFPLSMPRAVGFPILHRFVPVCAMQVIAAGVGASWITSWLPARVRHHWMAVIPALMLAFYVFAEHRHEVRDHNAVTDEFWMLRNHLAPGGVVNTECPLLFVSRPLDTDIHDFGQVLPGIRRSIATRTIASTACSGGCFYYLRSLNCFFAEARHLWIASSAVGQQRGPLSIWTRAACTSNESWSSNPLEERTVDLYAVFHGHPDRPQWPQRHRLQAKVLGVRGTAP
jgi:hypothetical protein